jgi:5'-3' exonuclease
MGIEKFFSTINRTFNIITTIDLNILEDSSNIDTDYLYIDFNSIIHQTSSKLLEKLNSPNDHYKNLKIDDIEMMIIKEINNFIISILERLNIKELKSLYIAIDGVPSFAKILEQKKRRFMGDFVEKLLEDYSLPFNWSKNNISPGTLFMEKISKFLLNIKSFTKNKLVKDDDLILDKEDYQYYTNLKKIIISDSNVRGEGEMKIVDVINSITKDKKDRFLVYSPDADMILLCMILNKSNQTKLLKYDDKNNKIDVIDIRLLKETIYNYCFDRLNKKEIKKKNLITDLVFIFTIFGNDFLPRCEAIQTNQDFLLLIDLYLINYIDKGHIIINNNIVNSSLFNYFNLIKNHEKRLLFRNSYQNIYQNYNYANQKNFIIDLLKLKDNQEIMTPKKFGEPFYNFINNVLLYVDPYKLYEYNKIETNKYGCLNFYLLNYKELTKLITGLSLLTNELLYVNISDINKDSQYDQLHKTQYTSKNKKHMLNMKDMTKRQVEMYLINNKLDKYNSLFNPISDFFLNIQTTRNINETYYYNKYFDGADIKSIVNTYLYGLKWVFQYYFHRKIDELWYYPYLKTPLFDTIVKYYTPSIIDTYIKVIEIDLVPLEQLLYITPIRQSDLTKPKLYSLFTTDDKLIIRIKSFVERHPEYFYNLDEIYSGVKSGNLKKDLFDCSNSSFISKCHYEILNYVVNIRQFVSSFRGII